MRLDPSIDPVKLVHRLCTEAHAHPETKKSRWIKRMHPVTSMRKTLSVDLAAFAKEILKPHFHSGGPPKTVSLRPPTFPLWAFGQSKILLIWELIRSSTLLWGEIYFGHCWFVIYLVRHSAYCARQFEAQAWQYYQDCCWRCRTWASGEFDELWFNDPRRCCPSEYQKTNPVILNL